MKVPKPGVPGQSLVRATTDVRKCVRDFACHVIERDALGRVRTGFKDRHGRVRCTNVTVRRVFLHSAGSFLRIS